MLKKQPYNDKRDYDLEEPDDNFEKDIEEELVEEAKSKNQKSIVLTRENVPLPDGWKQIKGKDGLIYTLDEKGTGRCGALKNGKYCHRYPVAGRNRCPKHGGKTPRGSVHHKWKDGRYSKDMPSRLAERYTKAVEDKELLNLREEIGVIEARIGDLLTRVDTGESGSMWRAIKTNYSTLRKAASSGDQQAFADSLNELGRLITKGSGDYTAWDEVLRTISHRRKLVESERKRLTEMNQMITTEQAMAMLSFVVGVIKKHVVDKQTMIAISSEISRYVIDSSIESNIKNN